MRATVALLCVCAAAHAGYVRQTFHPRVESLLANLTLAQKIGQMTQLNIDLILTGPESFVVNKTQVQYYIENFFVGRFVHSNDTVT